MAITVLDGLDAVRSSVGRHLGRSGWVDVGRRRRDRFAEAVGRSELSEPYLLLSLSNLLLPQILEVRGVSMGVNYGTGQVRFPAPVPDEAQVRAGADLLEAADVRGGLQTMIRITLEATDGAPQGIPHVVCVIDSLSRWLL